MIATYKGKRETKFYARVHLGKGTYAYGEYRETRDEAVLDEARIRLEGQTDTPPLVSEICDWHLAVYPTRPRKRTGEPPRASTVQTSKYAVNAFRAVFGSYRVDELDRDSLLGFIASHKSQIAGVVTMFSDAVQARKITDNPLTGLVEKKKRRRKSRDEFMSEAEQQLLVEIAYREEPEFPTLGAMIDFMCWTAVRQSEAFALRRSDLSGTILHVRHNRGATGETTSPKNHRARSVYLPPRALEAVEALPIILGAEHVFLNKRHRQFTRPAFAQMWKPIKTTFLNAIPSERRWAMHDGPIAAGEKGFVPHHTRHFCATWLLDQGISRDDVADQLGVDADEIKRTYGHPDEVATRDRLSRAHKANVKELRDASAR